MNHKMHDSSCRTLLPCLHRPSEHYRWPLRRLGAIIPRVISWLAWCCV